MYSYLKHGDTGLIHALLGPTNVTTEIDGKVVSVDCETEYPFRNTLTYSITSETPFTLYLRVPRWSMNIKLNSNTAPAPDSNGLTSLAILPGKTTVSYEIDSTLRTETRANDTIAVYNGALLYSLYIPPVISSSQPHYYDTQQEYVPGTYPPWMLDHVMLNLTEWNVAVDPSTLVFHPGEGALPAQTFDDGKLPMFVTVQACVIDWPMFRSVPDSPPLKGDRTCIGDVFEATLRPYGSSKLHMSDLPTIDLSGPD